MREFTTEQFNQLSMQNQIDLVVECIENFNQNINTINDGRDISNLRDFITWTLESI
jgi:hypothetical protein